MLVICTSPGGKEKRAPLPSSAMVISCGKPRSEVEGKGVWVPPADQTSGFTEALEKALGGQLYYQQ
jgi:hypothetical protein